MYTIVLVGGSVGEGRVRSRDELRGRTPVDGTKIFEDRKDAMQVARRMSKAFSPGEKKYYGLKYVSCEIVELAGRKYFNGK